LKARFAELLRLIRPRESRRQRNVQQQAAKGFIIGILRATKGALDQPPDEEDTGSE